MAEDDSQLRARITALGDLELARMLTLDADNHRVQALLVAKAEARARNLDLERLEDELRSLAKPSRESAPEVRVTSLAQVAPLDLRGLPSLWPWALVVAAGLAIEVWIELRGEQMDARTSRAALLCGSLLGFACYLRAVHGLHVQLRNATGGLYPITPAKSVWMHLVPILCFFWPFEWGAQVSRFAEVNGQGKAIDRYVPGVLFLAAYASGYLDCVLRLLLLCATVAYVQLRLKRNMRYAPCEAGQGAEWSSRAEV